MKSLYYEPIIDPLNVHNKNLIVYNNGTIAMCIWGYIYVIQMDTVV